MIQRAITYGVFDFLHLGHVRLFANIKHCILNDTGSLIVALHADACIKSTKPDAHVLYPQAQRAEMLGAIKYIDDVVIYDFIDTDLPNRDFDILVVGPDQVNEHFQRAINWCHAHKKTVVVMPRTKNISSTEIKNKIAKELKL